MAIMTERKDCDDVKFAEMYCYPVLVYINGGYYTDPIVDERGRGQH